MPQQKRITDSNSATTIGGITASHLPLIVGAFDGHDRARPAAPFSSGGPSRDLRPKPDLAAPDVAVLAARSAPIIASRSPGLLTRKSGTSMATPHVTGAVALCLQTAGTRLGARQIRSLVLGSCDPVPDSDACRPGRGYLNVPRLIADVQQALTAPAIIRGAKDPTMDTDDIIALLTAAPATAYREYLYRPHGQLAHWIDDRFDVVARPGQLIDQAVQPGDVLLAVTLGHMGPGRCLVLRKRDHRLAASPPRLPPGQLLLRPRGYAEMSEPLPVKPAAEIPDIASSPPAETGAKQGARAAGQLVGSAAGMASQETDGTLIPAQTGTAGENPDMGSRPPVVYLRSQRFRESPALTDLEAVANGRLRLGRPQDPQYPAPIVSTGPAVKELQQALIELGWPLLGYDADGRYGNETYQAVLAYKRQYNIRTAAGYLDGIVGPKTIQHIDAALPHPPCPVPGAVTAVETDLSAIPGLYCKPLPPPPPPLPESPYAGMDAKDYPGSPIMEQILAKSNIVWTGMYFNAPTHVTKQIPNQGAKTGFYGHFSHGAHSWEGAWNELHPAWGLLPIYWGQQQPGNESGPYDLRLFIAVANADEAAEKAFNDGIPAGAVIYLDWEMPGTPSEPGVTYCTAWFTRLAELGYRPGVYCFPAASNKFRKSFPRLFVWNVNLIPPFDSPAGNVVGSKLILSTPALNAKGAAPPDPESIARQWKFGGHFPPKTTIPIAGFPGIDANVSAVGDPSFPERHVRPTLVRGGTLVGMVIDATPIELFAVRRGALVTAGWTGSALLTLPALPDHALAFNPWSANGTLQRGTWSDLAVVARSATAGTPDNAWQLHAYRRRGTTWTFDTNINGVIPIEPLLGVALVSRAPNTVEAFFVTNDGTNRVFVVSSTDAAVQKDGQTWSLPTVVNAPAAGIEPSITGGIAAVSRAAGAADVFIVATPPQRPPSWQLYWNSSGILGTWPNFSVPGDPTVFLHPFSNVAVVSRGPQLLDVFAFAKGFFGSNWTLYHWWWNQADGWGAAPHYHTHPIIGTDVWPHPMSKVAAVSRSPQFIDVFFAGGDDGLLYTASWNGSAGTWSDFSLVGSNHVLIRSVDGAFSRAGNLPDVIVTGRDGNVYVSSWDTAQARYRDLTQVTSLNPS